MVWEYFTKPESVHPDLNPLKAISSVKHIILVAITAEKKGILVNWKSDHPHS